MTVESCYACHIVESRCRTSINIYLHIFSVCSEILFDKAFETQRMKEENLRQLKLEALIRERNALSSAVVEFKVQVRMSEGNVAEYKEQVLATSSSFFHNFLG